MKSRTGRICIYPKDIQRITGKSERYSRALLSQMKKKLRKEEHQFITIHEFCQHTGLPLEAVIPLIVD